MPTTNTNRSGQNNTQRFERVHPDGSKEVFDSPADQYGNIFLTQIVDPQNNSLTLSYTPVVTASGTA